MNIGSFDESDDGVSFSQGQFLTSFFANGVAAEYLADLRGEYEEWLEKIHEIIRTTKVKIPPEILHPV